MLPISLDILNQVLTCCVIRFMFDLESIVLLGEIRDSAFLTQVVALVVV